MRSPAHLKKSCAVLLNLHLKGKRGSQSFSSGRKKIKSERKELNGIVSLEGRSKLYKNLYTWIFEGAGTGEDEKKDF